MIPVEIVASLAKLWRLSDCIRHCTETAGGRLHSRDCLIWKWRNQVDVP